MTDITSTDPDQTTGGRLRPQGARAAIGRRGARIGAGVLTAGVLASTTFAQTPAVLADQPATSGDPLVASERMGTDTGMLGADSAQTLATSAALAPDTGSAVGRLGTADAMTQTRKAQAKAEAKRAKKKAARAAAAAEARKQAEAVANAEVIGKRYTTTAVNVREEPSTDSEVIKSLDRGTKVTATDNTQDGFRQIRWKGEVAWIKSSYLTKTKPKAEASSASTSNSPCKHGSGVEAGLTANAIKVHRSVCAAFPSVTSYGGVRASSGNHGTGRALDIMVSGGTGDEIAAYVRAHAKELGVSEVIWAQRIWTVQRSSDGWRSMSDRGSATANHYDHVHVSVY